MTFSEYLQKLYPFYGNGDKEHNFLIRLLSSATTEQNDKVFDYKPEYVKRIFNGEKNIKKESASYILTHLDKTQFDCEFFNLLSDDSLIELCKEFEEVIGTATKDDITQKLADLFVNILKDITMKKHNKKQKNELNDFESSLKIEQALAEIVNNLSKISKEEIDSIINYEPYNIDKKILPQNDLLKYDIKNKVVKFYVQIENLFKQASKNNSAFFDNLAKAVKFASDNFIKQNLPQQVIYDNMTQWLKNKALSSDDTACRIMVAFFIQNCEVFHEIA